MGKRVYISVLVYMMVQAVLFGVVTLIVLTTPLVDYAMTLWPLLIVASFILAVPLSWLIAPRLMLRYRRRQLR